jgi:hypothetical protein
VTALLEAVHDAVLLSQETTCKSPHTRSDRLSAPASHTQRPIVNLYVIYIILFYAPFALRLVPCSHRAIWGCAMNRCLRVRFHPATATRQQIDKSLKGVRHSVIWCVARTRIRPACRKDNLLADDCRSLSKAIVRRLKVLLAVITVSLSAEPTKSGHL